AGYSGAPAGTVESPATRGTPLDLRRSRRGDCGARCLSHRADPTAQAPVAGARLAAIAPWSSLMIQVRPAVPSDALPLSRFGARTFRDAFAAENRPENLEAFLAKAYGVPQQ